VFGGGNPKLERREGFLFEKSGRGGGPPQRSVRLKKKGEVADQGGGMFAIPDSDQQRGTCAQGRLRKKDLPDDETEGAVVSGSGEEPFI